MYIYRYICILYMHIYIQCKSPFFTAPTLPRLQVWPHLKKVKWHWEILWNLLGEPLKNDQQGRTRDLSNQTDGTNEWFAVLSYNLLVVGISEHLLVWAKSKSSSRFAPAQGICRTSLNLTHPNPLHRFEMYSEQVVKTEGCRGPQHTTWLLVSPSNLWVVLNKSRTFDGFSARDRRCSQAFH